MTTETIKLTEAQIKALTIISGNDIEYASAFAELYFGKDHPGWRRICKCGHGSSRGGGMNLWAGGYLGKLRKKKLISGMGSGRRFMLTQLGQESLKAAKGLAEK